MGKRLTWQEAKSSTQTLELEIASLIPKAEIASVDQQRVGILFSCDQNEHRWKGATTIAVKDGAQIAPFVKTIEAHFSNSKFEVGTRQNVAGNYEVQLLAPDGVENYIVSEGFEPDEIRIDSGSACFTLPEDVYPGGDF